MNSTLSDRKACRQCGIERESVEFDADSRRPGYRRPVCKECRRARERACYADNPHPVNDRNRRYREKNTERLSEYYRKYYIEHRDRIRERKKAYDASHRPQAREASRRWVAAHRERARISAKRWQANNPARLSYYVHRRRALLQGATAGPPFSRFDIWARDGGRCHICHEPCDPNHWHLDHLVPLSKGGPHTADNVAVSHPRCNVRRGNTGPAQLRLPDATRATS